MLRLGLAGLPILVPAISDVAEVPQEIDHSAQIRPEKIPNATKP